jgi:hypothetical protein
MSKLKDYLKSQKIKPYLKDILAILCIFILSLKSYQKPTISYDDKINKSNNMTDQIDSKENITETLKEDPYPHLSKSLSLFKGTETPLANETKITQPTFKEILFGEKPGTLKLLAIMGREEEKKAYLVDHQGNLRIIKKGDKIDEVIVFSITDKAVKFKWKNQLKEIYLYTNRPSPNYPSPQIEPISNIEEKIEEEERIKRPDLRNFRPKRERIM